MQASTGVNGEHYFMGAQCDPNLLAYAAQHALYSYPQKSMYAQVLQAPQVSQFMLPHQALMHPMSAAAPTSVTPIQSMPDMDKAALEEPIEAGSLNYRRKNTSSCSSEEKSQYRRHSATWETMTDDERELIQRQKRKEEAFKTALCDAYKRAGVCPYGDECRFAHGENELRMPSQPRGKAHPKYKTQLCDKFSTYGHCPYGPRCQFIHKLKKGLPLMEYNRALAQGSISPARLEEIVNPDDSDLSIHQYRSTVRRRSGYDFSDSGYGGKYVNSSGQSGNRRNLAADVDFCDDERRSKVVYPPMQVVNIEMATGQKKNQRRSLPSVINQADYQASMASGKIFGKPENIRTYGAMIRANEEIVDRCTPGSSKKERQCVPMKKDLSLIREEDTIADSSQLHQQSGNGFSKPAQPSQQKAAITENSPWYEKIFGKKMSVISEESNDSLQNDTTQYGGAPDA